MDNLVLIVLISAGIALLSAAYFFWSVVKRKVENKELGTRLISIMLVLVILFMPGVMLSVNYHSHDRSGNYVAWDYSYNIL